MTRLVFVLLIVLTACGGSLSEEQRKKMRENMEAGEIRKVTDAELTEAAFALGRMIAREVEASGKNLNNKSFVDSLQQELAVNILFLEPGDSMLAEVEKQIIEAYTSGSEVVVLNDNVQDLHNDTLLYTKPILRELPDGSTEFTKALGIRMPVKSVILSIQD
jgi:hypothetical protein